VWQGTNGKSPLSSPDPLLLSLTPKPHHGGADDSRPNDRALELQMTASTVGLDQDPGAESGASPSWSIRLPSPEFDPQRLPSSPDPFTVPDLHALDTNPNATFAIDNGISAAAGRYSMRTRQLHQLKPYAFDRLAYKQQLKHHPDAIVKLNARHSPVESSSRSSEGDTDGASDNSGGERPSEDARILLRSKGKKRRRASEGQPPVAHRRTSGVPLSSGSPLDRRFTGSSAIMDLALVTSVPDTDDGGSPVEAAVWYPDAFHELSSRLGSDDMPLNTVQSDLGDSRTPPSRVKRRRV
jgi:hypothetical protein